MGWKRGCLERPPRPKARKLIDGEKSILLKSMENSIKTSPVLTALHYRIRSLRGRFYYEQFFPDTGQIDIVGRVTPLEKPSECYLLEYEYSKGNWKEIAQGKIRTITNAISGDKKGTFHGLGKLDKSIRKAKKTKLDSLEIIKKDNACFYYPNSEVKCSVQEVLFHYFGVPITIIAEPREWYAYHRIPHIIDIDEKNYKILVFFMATSRQGDSFGGTCLYMKKDGKWDVFRIKPNQSDTIESSSAWLEKRQWEDWKKY